MARKNKIKYPIYGFKFKNNTFWINCSFLTSFIDHSDTYNEASPDIYSVHLRPRFERVNEYTHDSF